MDGNWVQVMQLFPSASDGRHQLCLFQDRQMPGNRLSAHFHPLAKLAQGLSGLGLKPIQQCPTAGIRQGLEHVIHDLICNHMVAYQ